MSGMLTSSRITANSCVSTSRSASAPELTNTRFCCNSSSTVLKTSSFSCRSSTTRMSTFSASGGSSASPELLTRLPAALSGIASP